MKNWSVAPRLENCTTTFLKGLRYASSTSPSDRERINRILSDRANWEAAESKLATSTL